MTHRLLHAEAALVEALAVSVDNINKPVWSRLKMKASDWSIVISQESGKLKASV